MAAQPPVHPLKVYLASLAPGSRRTMYSALNTIAKLLTSNQCDALTLDWSQIRYQHTAAVRYALQESCVSATGKPYSPATINRMLSALKGILKEVWRLDMMSVEDYQKAVDLKQVKVKRIPTGRSLAPEEIAALMRVCAEDTTAAGPRDAAMIGIFCAGLRRSEVADLDLDDFQPATGALKIRSGKGDKDRETYLPGGAIAAVNDWLSVRGSEPGPLLYPLNKAHRLVKRRMTAQALMFALKRRGEQAGLPPFSPHDLRRTFISQLLDSGVDILVVQRLAGHVSPVTTARYDKRGEAASRRAMQLIDVPYQKLSSGHSKKTD